jgi:hypothetical protein
MACAWLNLGSQLRRLVPGFSPRRTDFNPRLAHAGYVVGRLVLRQALLRVIPSSFINYNSRNAPYSSIIRGRSRGPIWGCSTQGNLPRSTPRIKKWNNFGHLEILGQKIEKKNESTKEGKKTDEESDKEMNKESEKEKWIMKERWGKWGKESLSIEVWW